MQAVSMIPACPVGITPVPPPPQQQPLTLSSGRAGAGAWLQAVLFTLLAWAAAVCTGLGGTVGVASQSLANKPAANAQHLQRHGGNSLASRAVRRDQTSATSVPHVAQDSQALAWDLTDGTLSAEVVGLRIATRHSDEPPLSTTQPDLKPGENEGPVSSRAIPLLDLAAAGR